MHQRSLVKARRVDSGRRKPSPPTSQRREELGPRLNADSVLYLQRTIGNRATVAYLQRQEEEGSVTVASSTNVPEEAADTGSYTQGLVGERDQDQTPTEEEFTSALESRAVNATFSSQHPSIAQIGIRPKEIKGKKLGVYISNSSYTTEGIDDLPGAARDAEAMKATMEGHGYKTLAEHKDQNASGIDAAIKTAIPWASKGDALLIYYAGHGLPQGMVGVNADVKSEGAGGQRGVKVTSATPEPVGQLTADEITDIEYYSRVLAALETGKTAGVHTTLVADACHTGAATDLVRAKAVEKLAEGGGSERVDAIVEQIARLEDLKQQVNSAATNANQEDASSAEEGASRGLVLETDEETKSVTQVYWEDVVRPELETINQYLKEGGLGVDIPETLGDYSAAGIEQHINRVINKLVDLGEQIKQEEKESTLQKAPG